MTKIFTSLLVSILLLHVSYSQTVNFTYQTPDGLFCSPSTVQFTQACTGNPISFIWDFGNGKSGYTANEKSSYLAPGSYTVQLTAIFQNSILRVSKTIVINPSIKVAIRVDRNYICLPGVINFTASATGNIATYRWDFGDGTNVLDTGAAGITHNFANFGRDSVLLRATDISGCYADTNIIVSIKNPPVAATATPSRGCAPINVVFADVVDIPTGSSIVKHNWNFGDGSAEVATTVNSTNHDYLLNGSYFPQVTITTSEGCTATLAIPVVTLGLPIDTTIVYTKTPVICGSDTGIFVGKAAGATGYFWNFNDGTTVYTTDTIVGHRFTTLGNKTVGVSAVRGSCSGNYTRTNITIIGVVAKYDYPNSCADKNIYSFANTSLGEVSSRRWDFGDVTQPAVTNTVVHTYPKAGQFLSSLIVNNISTGCADTTTRVIYTAVPSLGSSVTSICKNDSVTFSITNSYKDTAARYIWNLLGVQTGPDSNTTIKVRANKTGSFDNFVVINRGPQLCADTVRLGTPVIVKGPVLDFTVLSESCFNDSVRIVNNSQPSTAADTVKLWSWNYGNTAQNDFVYQPAHFQYATPGSYNITLAAIDNNGCTDTLIKPVNIKPSPFLRVTPADDTITICGLQPVNLSALSNDRVIWSPAGSLSCSVCDSTIANPQSSTKYFATVSNSFNCSIQDSIYIDVYTPFIATTSGWASVCGNTNITLAASPAGKKIVWSPANTLSDPAAYNTIASPFQNTLYTAALTDSAGCISDTATFEVFVNPLPVVDAGPDKFYTNGTDYTMTPVYSNNVVAYSWTPNDQLNCGSCALPTGIASYPQQYTLTVTSDSGCVATDSVTISTESVCRSADLFMPKAFTPNNDGLNDLYYPLAKGYRSIVALIIYNRQGQIVFSARNYPPNERSFGWNGSFNGKDQPVGTYIYTLSAICALGEKVTINGSFILVR